jgi:hypothetical protein
MQCPICSGSRLSPETETGPYRTAFRSGFRAGGKLKTVQIGRGRTCRDCGHVLLFVGRKELSTLDPFWDELEPNER